MIDWTTANRNMKKSREKYGFYFGDYTYNDFSSGTIANRIPRQHVGWGKRAVEMRANKTKFDCFENDTLGFNELFEKYRVKEAFDKIKEDVLVCGCGFLAVTGDRVFPFTAEEATGNFSFYDQNLSQGLAVFRDTVKKPIVPGINLVNLPDSYIEYYKDKTIVHNNDRMTITFNTTGKPLIGLLTHKSTAKRPFGRSVISLPARNAIIDASRTIRQAMIAAYHYNTKVDVILGADNETPVEKVESRTGDILKIGTNADGQMPQIAEFAQHAMAPFTDTILTAARNFCSDTKLSLANLGISTDAPQSTEALEILNDDLRDDIMAWQNEIGEQLKAFALVLWQYEHDLSAQTFDDNLRAKIREIRPVFLPVYRADVSKFGDGLIKIAQQAPGIVKSRTFWRNIGLTSAEIDTVINSTEGVL